MTRPLTERVRVADLLAQGLSQAEAARRTAIPRSTLRGWMTPPRSVKVPPTHTCPGCSDDVRHTRFPERQYAYLLGLYLGDGCLARHPRDVFKLRIFLDSAYPEIVDGCAAAMATVLPNRVGLVHRRDSRCVEVMSSSKHWPCLFPQHGPGPKHRRPIVLAPWQRAIADTYPKELLRGLIHSDGWRGVNRVNGHEYPRYNFKNESEDILHIFGAACDQLGIRWTRPTKRYVSVARADDVARLDEFIGPKR